MNVATLNTRQLRLLGVSALVVVFAGAFLVISKHKSSSPSTASSTPAVTTPAQTTPTTHKRTLDAHGLPVSVARALQKHSVVVVSLFAPGADVDKLAAAEARAGAMEMSAGFVSIDVYHQRPGTAILHKLGVLNTPAVLVVKRPANIYSEFTGMVDRDVVEQAVADAR